MSWDNFIPYAPEEPLPEKPMTDNTERLDAEALAGIERGLEDFREMHTEGIPPWGEREQLLTNAAALLAECRALGAELELANFQRIDAMAQVGVLMAELEEARIAEAALSEKLAKWEAGHYEQPTVTLNVPTVQSTLPAELVALEDRVAALENSKRYEYLIIGYQDQFDMERSGWEYVGTDCEMPDDVIMRRPRQDASDGIKEQDA